MRIIGGKLRSRRIEAPPGNATRPTGDRAKVALFNILQGMLENARVLDGFAGSGALSFEALSRGAAEAVLIEQNAEAVRLLHRNARSLELVSLADIRQGDFLGGSTGLSGRIFDIIFLDPPYDAGLLELAIKASDGLLAPGGVIVAEHRTGTAMPETIGSLERTGHRRYGATVFSFYKRQEDI